MLVMFQKDKDGHKKYQIVEMDPNSFWYISYFKRNIIWPLNSKRAWKLKI